MLESAGHALIILIEQGFSGEKLSPLRYPLKVPISSCLRVPISDAPFVCVEGKALETSLCQLLRKASTTLKTFSKILGISMTL